MFDNIRIPAIEEPSNNRIIIDIDMKPEHRQNYSDESDNIDKKRNKELIEII